MLIKCQKMLVPRFPCIKPWNLQTFSQKPQNGQSSTNECGHKFIDTADLCTNDIYKILWTSLDLKTCVKNQHYLGKPLQQKRVTMLSGCQSQCVHLIIQAAVRSLGAKLNIMLANTWEDSTFKKDVGRFYSLFSDVIFTQGKNHRSLCEFTEGATVPVINISSHKFVPLHGLAVLMTLQEHFGRLTGLSLAWLGPMGNKLNTLIYLLPKVGINLQYNCSPTPNFPSSPLVLPTGKTFCKNFNTKIEECPDPEATVKGVNVIVTSKHRNETLQINLKMFDKANDWIFLHLLPRFKNDVSEEVFNHKNSLVWTLHENIQYTTMAILLHLLKNYRPIIKKPSFE